MGLPSVLSGGLFATPAPAGLRPPASAAPAQRPTEVLGYEFSLPTPNFEFDFAELTPETVGAGEFPELALGDFELKFDDPTRGLSGLHTAVAERISQGSNAIMAINQAMTLALQGQSLEDQRRAAIAKGAGAQVEALMAKTAHLDDEAFAQRIERLRSLAGGAPTMPARAPLQNPNLGQLALALVGALTNPRYAAEIAASPFLQRLQEQAIADQRNQLDYQAQQQDWARRLGLEQEIAGEENRRDLTRAQLEQQREAQREASLRSATSDLNAGNGSVAQVRANLAQLRATYDRIGLPLPEGFDETERILIGEAERREKEQAELKRMQEQGKNDRARLGIEGRLAIAKMRSQDNEFDELMRLAGGDNPNARAIAAERLRENYRLFADLSDEEIARVSALTPTEIRANEDAETNRQLRPGKVEKQNLENDILRIRKQFIKPEYIAKIDKIHADIRQADERIAIARKKGADALQNERAKAVDSLRTLDAEAEVFGPQLKAMEEGEIDASDQEIAAIRKLLGKNRATRTGLQRQIRRIDRDLKSANASAAGGAPNAGVPMGVVSYAGDNDPNRKLPGANFTIAEAIARVNELIAQGKTTRKAAIARLRALGITAK